MARPVVKTADPGTKQQYRPLSEQDKAAIVAAIETEYTLSAATRAALGDMSRYSAACAAAKSDPAFGLAIERAREVHRDTIRATIAKLALGHMEPLSFRGELTGHEIERHDIEALKLLSRSRLPEHLDKRSEVSGSIAISVDDSASSRWAVAESDLVHLSDEQKRQLAAIIRTVQQGRNALNASEREFNAITDQSSDAIDAEYVELDSEFDTARLAAEVF
jgi:hypothetical protein